MFIDCHTVGGFLSCDTDKPNRERYLKRLSVGPSVLCQSLANSDLTNTAGRYVLTNPLCPSQILFFVNPELVPAWQLGLELLRAWVSHLMGVINVPAICKMPNSSQMQHAPTIAAKHHHHHQLLQHPHYLRRQNYFTEGIRAAVRW